MHSGGRSAGNMAAGYWVQGITEEQEAEEELQHSGLKSMILPACTGLNKCMLYMLVPFFH